MSDWGSMAGELVGALPSWDDVSGAASGVADWFGGMAPSMGEMIAELMPSMPSDFLPSMPDIGPSLGELIGPGGLPGDFLPSDFLPSMPDMPDIGPYLGELVGPGGLPGDFLPGGGGGGIMELMPSMPDIPWDMAGELVF
jgi:hypothetical protein